LPKIKLKRKMNEIEIEGEIDFIQEMLQKYDWFLSEDYVLADDVLENLDSEIKQDMEFGDFYEKINPEKQFEKIMCAVYYLVMFDKIKELNPKDITTILEQVKEKITGIGTVLDRLVKNKKFLALKENKYVLLRKGQKEVENWLKGELSSDQN